MCEYRGIEFAKGYNKPFSEFKEEFGSNHIFNKFPPKEREQELKKAHKIATNQKLNDQIKVVDAQILSSEDGNITATIGISEESVSR